eukprot:m51a1_g9167 hypothetical protein (157) ;mRNA; f:15993-16618
MTANGVQPPQIKDAGTRASFVLEDREDDRGFLRPCGKCCLSKGLPLIQISGEMGEVPAAAPGTRTFMFYRCTPHCNSSRLHLGGRVKVVLDVRGPAGEVVATAMSPPLVMHSKPGRKNPAKGKGDTVADVDAGNPQKKRKTLQQADALTRDGAESL